MMFRLFPAVFASLLCFSVGSLQAQQTLADGEWFERQIAVGVKWKQYQFSALYGSKQLVTIVEADLSQPGVKVVFPYLASTRARTSVFVPQQYPDAVAAVNGTYFDTSTGGGGATTFLRINNQIITPQANTGWGTNGGLTLTNTDVFRVQTRPSGGWDGVTNRRDIMGNGPILVFNTTVRDFSSIGSHCSARHPRTAVGTNPDNSRGYLVTVDGRTAESAGMTCDELAQVMAELGCDDALNMDGGGSTTMWIKGELHNGVVSYPSDNGSFDHAGERSCANAIAIVAPPLAAPAAAWDGRLTGLSYTKAMNSDTSQTAVLTYQNMGSETWTQANARLVVTRPRTRTSSFYSPGDWPSQTVAATLQQASVAPGGSGTFHLVLTAPEVAGGQFFNETFGLYQEGVGPFGPPDHEPYIRIAVEPFDPSQSGTIIIQSRGGGKNFTRYSETGGWADVGADCTATGLLTEVGQRYGSTFRSVAGAKSAFFKPIFSEAGVYKVSIAYGNGGSLARDPVTYEVKHAGGTQKFLVDQRINANTWNELGTFQFDAGEDGWVEMSNKDIDVSGSMYAGAVKFEQQAQSVVEDWSLY